MRILALDFGIKTGWASASDGVVESGVQEFPLERGESPGMRFLRFNAWLAELLKITTPEVVIYERAHHRGGYATDLLVGFSTRLQERCAVMKIEYEGVHSATLKKAAVGTGRADKKQMITEACRRFPDAKIADDNQADALLLLDYARIKFSNEGGT